MWDVWDVVPDDLPGRSTYDRRAHPRGAEPQNGSLFGPELEQGWLCFQSEGDRRRFAPIPPNWFELPDGVLRVMVDIATPVATNNTPRRTTTAD
jgi:hypothetical protein